MQIITDKQINELISAQKDILEKETKKKEYKYKRRNIKLKDEKDNLYQIFIRQNIENKNDFSCGLLVELEKNRNLILIRCNGNSHSHLNSLEKTRIKFCFHIHKATERYIQKNKKEDGFAEETTEYQNIEGAYQYLLKRCNIQDESLEETLFGKNIWN